MEFADDAFVLAARTTPDARYALLFNRLTIRPVGGAPTVRVLDADGIEAALREVFDLPVEAAWRPVIERAAAGAPV
jgi:N-hydroxyarylamine O-acetyltransferase